MNNILDKLGFTRKGEQPKAAQPQARPQHAAEEPNHENSSTMNFLDTTPRKEGEKRVYNVIILDESGSMHSIYSQALTGANETIQVIRTAQQDDPEMKQMLTFVTFDVGHNPEMVRAIIPCEPIESVKDLTRDQYRPDGCTPLYDAMGITIEAMKRVVKDGDNVLVTVITDGFENSSQFWTATMVKEQVDALSARGWVFTYIGANQDSEETSGRLGIHSSMDFFQDEAGTTMMFKKMQSSRKAYYKAVKAGMVNSIVDDFFQEKASIGRTTPERIDTLPEGSIFVFGSNLQGAHAGGAARVAVEKFGAVMGQGVGLQGQSYAIPTMQGGVETIKPYVDEFILFAERHPELKFYVTRIGCGIAGFQDHEIAPLFAGAVGLPNVYLPASFWKILIYKYNA